MKPLHGLNNVFLKWAFSLIMGIGLFIILSLVIMATLLDYPGTFIYMGF